VRVPVQIVECATSRPVEAELFDEVTVEHFLETQKEWRPVVLAAAKQLAQRVYRARLFPATFIGIGVPRKENCKFSPFHFLGSRVTQSFRA
jgi:hypothetical protein